MSLKITISSPNKTFCSLTPYALFPPHCRPKSLISSQLSASSTPFSSLAPRLLHRHPHPCVARFKPETSSGDSSPLHPALHTPPPPTSALESKCINTIRLLAVDAVNLAGSGHPGMPMGCAAIGYLLFTEFLRYNPKNPLWSNRDRFVLSAGHGSMLLYSLLHLTGFEGMTLSELQNLRQWNSVTPGHPENLLTPGVEVTTGPLGQGICNAVGLAAAEAHLAARFNDPDLDPIVDHYTVCLLGDGCMMEGITHEACSLAGHWGLGNLIAIYDDNHVTIDGSTSLALSEDTGKRFEAMGWRVLTLDHGGSDDVDKLRGVLNQAMSGRQGQNRQGDGVESELRSPLPGKEGRSHTPAAPRTKPTLIRIRTTIGFGSPNKAGSHKTHGSPLGTEEAKLVRQRLGFPPKAKGHEAELDVDEDVYGMYRKAVPRGEAYEQEWRRRCETYRERHPKKWAEFERMVLRNDGTTPHWEQSLPRFKVQGEPGYEAKATRQHSQAVLNALVKGNAVPGLLGGSADLASSTLTELSYFVDPDIRRKPSSGKEASVFSSPSPSPPSPSPPSPTPTSTPFGRDAYGSRQIAYGVREHAMCGISTGLALHHSGLIPFCATFLSFTDYMRYAIRMAAMSGAGILIVATHDSIGLGGDGPTHQPVEQLAALRAMPNVVVVRPAGGIETAGAYRTAIRGFSAAEGGAEEGRETMGGGGKGGKEGHGGEMAKTEDTSEKNRSKTVYSYSRQGQRHARPTVIVLSRQAMATPPGTSMDGVARGAYVVYQSGDGKNREGEATEKGEGKKKMTVAWSPPIPDLILMASGSELEIALEAAAKIEDMAREGGKGTGASDVIVRVVSMPSWELFDEQGQDYQDEVLPPQVVARVGVEAAGKFGWERYLGRKASYVGVNTFGASAPCAKLYEMFGVTADNVAKKGWEQLKRCGWGRAREKRE